MIKILNPGEWSQTVLQKICNLNYNVVTPNVNYELKVMIECLMGLPWTNFLINYKIWGYPGVCLSVAFKLMPCTHDNCDVEYSKIVL